MTYFSFRHKAWTNITTSAKEVMLNGWIVNWIMEKNPRPMFTTLGLRAKYEPIVYQRDSYLETIHNQCILTQIAHSEGPPQLRYKEKVLFTCYLANSETI